MKVAKRAGQCRFCACCRCRVRIVAIGFDEVACPDHLVELEAFAAAELPPGWPRELISSSGAQRRGPYHLDHRRPADRSPVELAEQRAVTVVPVLSREEREVMRHALGIERGVDGRDRHGRRNHFVGDLADPVWVGLEARGLARIARGPSAHMPNATWCVTRPGMVLVGAQLDDAWRS